MQFIHKVNQSIKKHNLLKFGDKVLVAVSGGADSLALLFSLNALKEIYGLRLYVAHLDHGLRRSAGKDRLFVNSIARKLEIPFYSKKINLKKFRRNGSLEEVARKARLDFLIKISRKINADKIALGHTKDDQAETVLMRILRGSGLYGLSSILPSRKINGLTFIRPLIETERNGIEVFLEGLKIRPRQDSTNFETRFFRNKIRLKLLPFLKKEFNPQIKQSLSNLAQISASDYEFIKELASCSLKQCKCRLSNKSLSLDLNKFLSLNKSLQRMVLRLCVEMLTSSIRRLTFKHWQEVEDMIYLPTSNAIVHFPRQISVAKQKGRIVITVRNS